MVKGMIADEMPFLMHAPDDILPALDILAQQKKGGFYTAIRKAVQKLLRIVWVRPVVKGQGKPLCFPAALLTDSDPVRICCPAS